VEVYGCAGEVKILNESAPGGQTFAQRATAELLAAGPGECSLAACTCVLPRNGGRPQGSGSPTLDLCFSFLDSVSIMLETGLAHDSSEVNARIASRMRARRAELRLPLSDLAARCGVSRSMISFIENEKCCPTIATLHKIASGLGVPLASLFEDGSAAPVPVSRRKDQTTWRDPESGYTRRQVSPASFPSPIQIVEMTLPAGALVAYESGACKESIHQQIWVQEGCIEVMVDGVTHRLAADDCLAMRLDVSAAFRNCTSNPARCLVVTATDLSRAVEAR
jgi:transcriptional regulator with XRE-family HTH domain